MEVSKTEFMTPSAFIFLYENQLFLTFRHRMVSVWNFRGKLVTSFEDHLLWHPDCNTNNIYITSDQDLIISYCKADPDDNWTEGNGTYFFYVIVLIPFCTNRASLTFGSMVLGTEPENIWVTDANPSSMGSTLFIYIWYYLKYRCKHADSFLFQSQWTKLSSISCSFRSNRQMWQLTTPFSCCFASVGSINISNILTGKCLAKITAANGGGPDVSQHCSSNSMCSGRKKQSRKQMRSTVTEALEDITALFYDEERNEIYTGNRHGLVHIWSNWGGGQDTQCHVRHGAIEVWKTEFLYRAWPSCIDIPCYPVIAGLIVTFPAIELRFTWRWMRLWNLL